MLWIRTFEYGELTSQEIDGLRSVGFILDDSKGFLSVGVVL